MYAAVAMLLLSVSPYRAPQTLGQWWGDLALRTAVDLVAIPASFLDWEPEEVGLATFTVTGAMASMIPFGGRGGSMGPRA